MINSVRNQSKVIIIYKKQIKTWPQTVTVETKGVGVDNEGRINHVKAPTRTIHTENLTEGRYAVPAQAAQTHVAPAKARTKITMMTTIANLLYL